MFVCTDQVVFRSAFDSRQVAPFWHGNDQHSSTSNSQLKPCIPTAQMQENASTGTLIIVEESWHVPPP